MAYETKEMSGALFVNENKDTDRHPDFTGNIKINGKEWRVAAWKTLSRANVEYMSLKISDPADFQRREPSSNSPPTSGPRRHMSDAEFQRERERRLQNNPRPSPEHDFDEDDIPF